MLLFFPLLLAAAKAVAGGTAAGAASGAAGGAATSAAGGGLMSQLGQSALGMMAGGPTQGAAAMLGEGNATMGGIGKQLLMDRVSNRKGREGMDPLVAMNPLMDFGIVGQDDSTFMGSFKDGGQIHVGSYQDGGTLRIPGDRDEEELISMKVHGGETITVTPPGETPPAGILAMTDMGAPTAGAAPPPQELDTSSFRALGWGDTAKSMGMGLLMAAGSKDPSVFFSGAADWASRIRDTREDEKLRALYGKQLSALGDPNSPEYDVREAERIQISLSNIEQPQRMAPARYQERTVIDPGGKTLHYESTPDLFSEDFTQFGESRPVFSPRESSGKGTFTQKQVGEARSWRESARHIFRLDPTALKDLGDRFLGKEPGYGAAETPRINKEAYDTLLDPPEAVSDEEFGAFKTELWRRINAQRTGSLSDPAGVSVPAESYEELLQKYGGRGR